MTQFESIYRIIGFGNEGRQAALYDIHRDDVCWINLIGYDDEIHSVLTEIDTGNVVEATVTDEREGTEYWDLVDIEIIDDTTLYFVVTDDYVPGPTDDIWADKLDEENVITTRRFKHDDKSKTLYELQLQRQVVYDEDEGERVDIFEGLQRGDYLTEPMFEGSGSDYLPDGARAILVVNPVEKEYIAIYLFEERTPKFEEIWGALYDYVDENTDV